MASLPRIRPRILTAGLLAAWVLTLASATSAQDATAIPACNQGREGAVACMGEKLCACRFDPGGSMTQRPPGFRWDCGALRPACGVVPPSGYGGDQQTWSMQDLPPIIIDPRALPGPMPRGHLGR